MNTKPKKILLATGIFPPEEGGPATYSKLLQDKLPAHGFAVEVFPFRMVRHLPKGVRHFVYFLKIWRAAFSADLVYAQDTVSVGFPALMAAKLSRRKFLIRVPGDYAWEQSTQQFGVKDSIDDFQNKKYALRVELLRCIQRFVVSRADLAITPSIYFRDLVRGWVRHAEKVITIYNGIDFDEIGANLKTFKPRTLITAGRLVPWKGFGELIGMMKLLPDWELCIAGDGPLRQEIQNDVADAQLEERITLLGSIPRSELIDKIQQTEVFILNTHFESFSYQIVEVMRARTPVITTNIGNLNEIVEDKKEGILVDPGNVEQIITAIQNIHNNKDMREAYTDAAYEKSEMFSIDNTLRKTAEAINSII